ncbi:cobyrinate a,c-diamide synthase [Asanoa sp. WMMD1127]|uniref:cobyrinate a,c-diamide synthase n=1 Tax=Asanoa sp. WMMD1127 TaxID=3016107 RepID=UPI002417E334|nr:cobyrinate a,c-diamide synthase [Asanoa sp. WMMD1127]MDG4820325.1 cobyrinate a,c-diamide synthase [Asanoa sp. WMMD1127]
MSAVPRVVVSAPSSGHGKTALAVGLLAAFAGRGLSAVGFKVGPDHTDAAYLGAAAGSPGRNLDPRLVGAHRVAPLFAHAAQGHDIAVVEGTMGLFDSLAGRVETDSTAGVAAALRAPVIMVVDVGAMGQSVAALMHGYRAYDELTWLGGVILNRVASDRHEQLLREALDDIGVPVYGALRRRDLPSTLPPRHEGVVPVLHREVEALRGIRRLGESIAATVDLDGLLALAHSAPNLPATPWSPAGELAMAPEDTAAVHLGRRPVVALAGGPGLSFAYAETRELLEAAGATVVAVDPLRDELLPEGTDALVVGGALPEAYAEELSANRRLCADVADLARSGRPVIAEGAGLLWLAQAFDGRPMCGVLETTGTTGDQMIVGYRDATARATTAVAEVGARVVGYKQHRGVVSPRAGQTPAWTWNGGTPEGFVWRRVHASQLSLHWAGFPEIARRLVLASRPGEGPGAAPGGGSWAQATGAVPVVGGALDYGTAEAPEDARRSPTSGGGGLRLVPGGGEGAASTSSGGEPPRLQAAPGGGAAGSADRDRPAPERGGGAAGSADRDRVVPGSDGRASSSADRDWAGPRGGAASSADRDRVVPGPGVGGADAPDRDRVVPRPPRLRVVPPLASDDDPTDGRGFAALAGDDGEQRTDGFGFAAVPGARAGAAMGDGYAYVMPPPDDAPPQPPAAPDARATAEFGFPLGRGEQPAAGSGFGRARPPGQASAIPADRPAGNAPAFRAQAGGVGMSPGHGSAVPFLPPPAGGQPVPAQGGEPLSGRTVADGSLAGGTAEVPVLPVRAPQPPRGPGSGGRMVEDDGGIA